MTNVPLFRFAGVWMPLDDGAWVIVDLRSAAGTSCHIPLSMLLERVPQVACLGKLGALIASGRGRVRLACDDAKAQDEWREANHA